MNTGVILGGLSETINYRPWGGLYDVIISRGTKKYGPSKLHAHHCSHKTWCCYMLQDRSCHQKLVCSSVQKTPKALVHFLYSMVHTLETHSSREAPLDKVTRESQEELSPANMVVKPHPDCQRSTVVGKTFPWFLPNFYAEFQPFNVLNLHNTKQHIIMKIRTTSTPTPNTTSWKPFLVFKEKPKMLRFLRLQLILQLGQLDAILLRLLGGLHVTIHAIDGRPKLRQKGTSHLKQTQCFSLRFAFFRH